MRATIHPVRPPEIFLPVQKFYVDLRAMTAASHPVRPPEIFPSRSKILRGLEGNDGGESSRAPARNFFGRSKIFRRLEGNHSGDSSRAVEGIFLRGAVGEIPAAFAAGALARHVDIFFGHAYFEELKNIGAPQV